MLRAKPASGLITLGICDDHASTFGDELSCHRAANPTRAPGDYRNTIREPPDP